MKKLFFLIFMFSITIYGSNDIRILHSGVTEAKTDSKMLIKSNAINSHLINYLIVHYKKANAKNWKQIEMVPKGGVYVAAIPKDEVILAQGVGIVYYIEVIDISGKSTKGFATDDEPQYVTIKKVKSKTILDDKKVVKKDDTFEDLSIYLEDNDFSAKKVTLASGKKESIMGTPFSVTVITRQEIENSGITTIPELFRLVPGMLVREQTAGNYDVHIRGLDNVPPNSFSTLASDMLTLLMINNRVVYDYQLGGVFWDALPIDINDIERVEIVRGPASAMYGPSAASGVINIVTRTVTSKNRYMGWVNIAKGNYDNNFMQGIAGYYQDIEGDRKLGIVVSGNFQNRGRFNSKIWSWTQDPANPREGRYVEPDELRSVNSNYKDLPTNLFVNVQYPYPNTGLIKSGFNVNVTYDLDKDLNIHVDAGAQNSVALKPWMETVDSFLLTHESKTQYINTKIKLWDVNTRISYTWGKQPIRGQLAMSNDIGILNTSLNYSTQFLDMIDIKAIMDYNNIQYGGLAYGGEDYKVAKFENIGLSLRTETSILDKSLKFVAAGRLDAFAHLEKKYFTFQLASIYNMNDKFVVRGVFSRANRNPFLGPAFYQVRNLDENNPTFYMGEDHELNLVTIDLLEFGTRLNLSKKLNFDLEIFYTTGKDFSHFVPTGNIVVVDGVSRLQVIWSQLAVKVRQYGATLSTNVSFSKVRTKFFITVQQTWLDDYNPTWFDDQVAHLNDPGETVEHKGTPTYFGGGYIDIGPFYKTNLNISTYYYGENTYEHMYDSVKISAKILFNLKLTYNVTKRSAFYFNARNVFNDKSREFGFADESGGVYIAGFNAKF